MLTQLPILDAPEALFRANIHHFLPDYPASRYNTCYQSVCALQRRAAADYRQISPEQLARLTDSLGDWLPAVRACPGIIATYHTGSYRLLSLCLAAAGLPLALLVSADVAAREREQMMQRQTLLAGNAPPTRSLIILEAEDPFVLRRTCRLLQQGYVVVMYVDGNTGAAGERSTHLLDLPFLSGRLLVRQGIPLLSFLASVPVYPIRCAWGSGQGEPPSFVTTAPLRPGATEARETYARRTMEQLYAFLEAALHPDPATWECWHYLHHWVPRESSSRSEHTLPARECWGGGAALGGRLQLFRQHEKVYLIDGKDYLIYPIEI